MGDQAKEKGELFVGFMDASEILKEMYHHVSWQPDNVFI